MYWCVVSLDDGHVDQIHKICKWSAWSDVTTKDNIIYISCHADDVDDDTGVYGFDILNPSQCKYKYKHERLQYPTSIVINEDGNIFVGNHGFQDSCIHQLTANCRPVAIFTEGIPYRIQAMFWEHERLYVACRWSRHITVFRLVYHGNHSESGVAIDERKQVIVEGTATHTGQEISIDQSVEEDLNQAGIKMSTEERNMFLKFQNEIGTYIYFSKGSNRLIDDQGSLKATDEFFEQSCPEMKDKWLEYKSHGKLTSELIDVICSHERNPELHHIKDEILEHMEDLNIIVKARSFDKNGVKEDNYFFAPCMLRLESPRGIVDPEQDPLMLRTSELCWVFAGTCPPSSIFDSLLASCLARWPVAKKKDTLKHLISHSSTVFELDLTHRLTLRFEDQAICASVTWLVVDDIKTPNAKLCTMVRILISRKLCKITTTLKQNVQYELCLRDQEGQDVSEDRMIHFSPFQIWFEDEIQDPYAPIRPEHMNHARLCVALVTVCGKALREILLNNFPVPYKDIYQTILANRAKLTGGHIRHVLNQEQTKLVFPDHIGQKTGTVDTFDLSLLYTLIRNVSTVQAPSTGWGIEPKQSDKSLGASVERIRLYRNRINGHCKDAEINDDDFKHYWKKFKDVLDDIEVVINTKVYSAELKRQRSQVISVFDDC
ncbi:hypothetical protein ACJMK2_015066 [Sinanodonta woodiana]|uniref:DZIP3-like HEPN domain-containing protein n=1 Tax=Sinanodonta woodiana TaxID=1069815 RepID=A0ABD3V2I1_SINWO